MVLAPAYVAPAPGSQSFTILYFLQCSEGFPLQLIQLIEEIGEPFLTICRWRREMQPHVTFHTATHRSIHLPSTRPSLSYTEACNSSKSHRWTSWPFQFFFLTTTATGLGCFLAQAANRRATSAISAGV